MVTLSEINRFRDYFSLTDNEIICDFCCNSYDIIINNKDVENHLKVKHTEYENAVSSKSTQKDLKNFYTIHNNNIKCFRCDKLYISWNTHSIIKYHLGVGHNTDEDKVNKFWKWIREKYELNESDGKQYCKKCPTSIRNRPAHLINHLVLDHNDEDCFKYRPSEKRSNRLDDHFDDWIWNYFIRNGKYAHCSVCNKKYMKCYKYLVRSMYQVQQHMVKHKEIGYVSLRKSKEESIECHYSKIQDDLVNCNICNTTIETPSYSIIRAQHHLEACHGIIPAHSAIFQNWVFTHIYKLQGYQKSQCKHCHEMFRKMCSYSLYEHLRKVHRIEMFSEFIPMGESSNSGSLLRSDENVKNISIFSMNPQAGTSKSSGIDVRDVDCDRDNTMGNLKRKLSSLSSSDKNVKAIATTSTFPQAGSSKDLDTDDRDSEMKKVKHDDDKRPLTELTNSPVYYTIDTEGFDGQFPELYFNEDSDDSETLDT